MTFLRACLLATACVLPTVTFAQWQWVDNQGRRVFSDQPPPADVPARNIVRQPGGGASPAAQPAESAAAPGAAASGARAAASAPKVSGRDPQLEEKKKQAEAAEAAKRKAADEELAAARAENCKQARRAKATFDSGVRIRQTNDKGEREVMDDKQRAAEVKRIEATIARDCAAAPQ